MDLADRIEFPRGGRGRGGGGRTRSSMNIRNGNGYGRDRDDGYAGSPTGGGEGTSLLERITLPDLPKNQGQRDLERELESLHDKGQTGNDRKRRMSNEGWRETDKVRTCAPLLIISGGTEKMHRSRRGY